MKEISEKKMFNIEGKNILVTGGAGFIASHFIKFILKKYRLCNVYTVDILEYCSEIKNLPVENERFKFIKGNILDVNLISSILKKKNIDIIVHFAAHSHVDISIKNPIVHSVNNFFGTQLLLEAVRKTNTNIIFVHISTDEVYGGEKTHVDENTIFDPCNPYSATKAAAECIVNAYHKTYNIPTIITRANNIYGPNQFPEKVIPKFILRLVYGKGCCLHGGGKTIRKFLYVLDFCEALDDILKYGEIGNSYNIGADEEIEIRQCAMILIEILNRKTNANLSEENDIFSVRDRAFNDERYLINDSKLRNLGWSPKTSFLEGIEKTVEWYINNLDYWGDVSNFIEPHPLIQDESEVNIDSVGVLTIKQ